MLLVAALSCRRPVSDRRDTIPLVKQLAVDTTGAFSLVQSYRNAGKTGSIAIIGEPGPCMLLAERFLTVDAVDNIDGKAAKDRLPDFAGEVFDIILDVYNAPYSHFAANSTDSLREVAVRSALFAVDSVCLSSAFNTANRLRKSRAKVMVLASSLLSEYGQFDIDTLFKMAGRPPLILSPAETMLADALEDGPADIAVWAPREAKAAYKAVFDRMDHGEATLTVVTPEETMDVRMRLREVLRRYRNQRPDGRLSAVIVDDFGMDLGMLQAEIEHIHLEITEEDLAFSRMLLPGFRFIAPMESLTTACYRLLRRENLFTHDIAYPEARFYQTEEGLDGDLVLVGISPGYLSSEMEGFIDINTSAARYFYVPDND